MISIDLIRMFIWLGASILALVLYLYASKLASIIRKEKYAVHALFSCKEASKIFEYLSIGCILISLCRILNIVGPLVGFKVLEHLGGGVYWLSLALGFLFFYEIKKAIRPII